MNRPKVICLMMTSVDGKILTEKWGSSPEVKKLAKSFEKAHEEIGVPNWLCGRTTMEKDFTGGTKPVVKSGSHDVGRIDFVGDKGAESFAVAIDKGGKLGWERNHIDGDHVIAVLGEAVPDGYLAQLQDVGVSYVFAGKEDLDLGLALEKLYNLFGIREIMLEGGGHINGSFLNEDMIDELNLLVLPIADGSADSSTVFEIDATQKKGGARVMKLEEAKKWQNDVVWLKYLLK